MTLETRPSSPLSDRVNALADAVASIADLDSMTTVHLAPPLIDKVRAMMAAVRQHAIADAVAQMAHAEVASGHGGHVPR